MKFKINTAKLHAMLSKVQRGVGNSKILPITEYLELNLSYGELSITATDLANFITVIAKDMEGEDGSVVVRAEVLIKLVAKTTVPEMTFTSSDKSVQVTGNGKYNIPLFETNEFPDYEFDAHEEGYIKVEVATSLLQKLFAVNRSAIATEMLMPCLTGYNIGTKSVTTDGIKMCINDLTVFPDTSMLVTETLANLIQAISAEKVVVEKAGNKILFTTDNLVIFGTELDGIDEYPDILPILDIVYAELAVVSKVELLSAIDRLSLFVDEFDNNGIRLTIGKEMSIQDLKKNSAETIKLLQASTSTKEEQEVVLNINYLKDILSVLSTDNVQFQYGEGLPVRIVEGNVTLILSTMTTGE